MTRDDPPHFLDVAVQNNAGGHRLYAAVDHLNWVRFDLGDPSNPWGTTMDIDHHEGFPEPRPVPERVNWLRAIEDSEWNPTLFVVDDLDGTPARDVTFTHRVDVVEHGSKTALVVGALNLPWFTNGRVKSPGWIIDQTFLRKGNVSGPTFEMIGSGEVTVPGTNEITTKFDLTCVYDDVDNLAPMHGSGVPSLAAPNLDRWLPVGAIGLFVPPDQSANGPGDLIRVVHGASTLLPASNDPMNFDAINYNNSTVCVSFFDLDPLADPAVVLPYWLRSPDDISGRYNFAAGFARADDRVVIQGGNDNALREDGLVWTDDITNSAGSLEFDLNPTPGVDDARCDTGTVFEQNAQWVDGTSTQWVIGSRSLPLPLEEQVWYFGKHTFITTTSGAPLVTLDDEWFIEAPFDRWERVDASDRPYYMSGMTNPAYDAYTRANRPLGEPEEDFVFFTRATSADGVQALARNLMVPDLEAGPNDEVQIRDPRGAFPSSPWSTFQLNTHPEWNNFPFDEVQFPGTGVYSWTRAREFWSTRNVMVEALATKTFVPKLIELPIDSARTSQRWVLAVPCDYAGCPERVDEVAAGLTATPMGTGGELPALNASYRPDAIWADQFGKAFALLFDVHDPWQLVEDALDVTPTDPAGSTAIDPLFLSRDGGLAFQVEHVRLEGAAGVLHDILFVVDFAGSVAAFDISDALYVSEVDGHRDPISVWDVPPQAMDVQDTNVYGVALDKVAPNRVNVYAAVPRLGVVVTAFEVATGFSAQKGVRIKTAGEAYHCVIRGTGADRVLLVDDSTAGYRFYGIGD
ncbi:MAG: hypothetical protein AAF726_20695 [Planctomycetota bacterium]